MTHDSQSGKTRVYKYFYKVPCQRNFFNISIENFNLE